MNQDLKERQDLYLIGALILVIALHNIPVLSFLAYPFNLMATWIHEMGHGLTAELVGGDFQKLIINSNSSGYARFTYNPAEVGTFSRALIASAGYMGTSIFGALMLFFRRRARFVQGFSYFLGLFMVFSLIIYIRSWTGWLFGVPFSALLIFIGSKKSELNTFFYNFLAGQIALNAIIDINVLFHISGATKMNGMMMKSDAAVVSELLIFPPWFWAGFWLFLSLLLFIFALRRPLSLAESHSLANH